MRQSFSPRSAAALAAILVSLFTALLFAAGPAAAGSASPYRFAPYVDMADWPPPKLDAIGADSGVRSMSLGFVTALDRDADDAHITPACEPTWGGYPEYAAAGDSPYLLGKVDSFRAAEPANAVVISFGGAAGTELAEACGSATELAAAYQGVIDAYGADRVDFDIEGDELDAESEGVNQMRNDAIASLESADRVQPLEVTYTLPVSTTGLEPLASELLADALDAGVEIEAVNAMAMDYGTTGRNPDMGKLAIGVAKALRGQLGEIYAAGGTPLDAGALSGKVAITPMIGINDVKREIFSIADARELVAYARDKQLGMLGMWQLTRDAKCRRKLATTQPRCSGVAQKRWQFAKTLGRFGG